ncbi:MAG: MBOAT family protein [bacterium]|nr:MBOAT family protein [bacterium]
MQFNSWEFLVFFPVVACLHFLLPGRYRWILLLAASYMFYMAWVPSYLVLILLSTGVDYIAGRLLDRTENRAKRWGLLLLSLGLNLGLLFAFKYFNFFSDATQGLFEWIGVSYTMPQSDLLLPVGISFYTFQTLSYTIEVFKGRQRCERHLGIFALYVAFFPQLVAGPIERPQHLLKQFYETHRADAARITEGLRLAFWGMFKKVVIADNLGILVDTVYGAPTEHGAPAHLIATVFFAFQIYCDFSGYSDIAIGTARILGFRLMKNFDRPYVARSIVDFWHRWHISLSTWFRDYLYIPLGGSRVPIPRWYLNLLITFVVSGLWHGASWTFVCWGAIHGGLYVVSTFLAKPYARFAAACDTRFAWLRAILERLVTFAVVCLAWVFFRADTVSDAFHIVGQVAGSVPQLVRLDWVAGLPGMLGTSGPWLWGMVGVVVLLQAFESFQKDGDAADVFRRMPTGIRWAAYLALGVMILNLGVAERIPFIYFQF